MLFRGSPANERLQEFLLRVKKKGDLEYYIGRRYGDFARLHKSLRTELPGKVLPTLPKKNRNDSRATSLISSFPRAGDEGSSLSSVSTRATHSTQATHLTDTTASMRNLVVRDNRRASAVEVGRSPKLSVDTRSPTSPEHQEDSDVILFRETQRVSLRALLRTLLSNPQIASTKAVQDFLSAERVNLSDADVADIERRKLMDDKRVEEQEKFYEIARKRAAELDIYMEKFRRDVIETNGLSKLFKEIKDKNTIQELSLPYQKFAEWLRIEVAATIYHLFLAEDNSPELFAQARKIHSMIPYTLLKNAIRIANPAAVMSTVLDIFLAQPFGTRSLMQRIFSLTLNDGIRAFQKSIDSLIAKIAEPVFCTKLHSFCEASEDIKNAIRDDSKGGNVDLIVAILRSDLIEPELTAPQIGKIFNAYVAWNNAVDNVDDEMKQGAELFSYLKQLLKLYTRQRDKAMMLNMIEEPVTLQLLRDLFTIFYEPLVRVYKSANVYNSITDFSHFVDDMIQVRNCFSRKCSILIR